MSVVVLLLLAPGLAMAVPPALPTPVAGQPLPQCPDDALARVVGQRLPGPHKLGDLPPANLYLAVDRHIGGCRKPIMIRSAPSRR